MKYTRRACTNMTSALLLNAMDTTDRQIITLISVTIAKQILEVIYMLDSLSRGHTMSHTLLRDSCVYFHRGNTV